MDLKEQYKLKLLNENFPNAEYICSILSEFEWYTCEKEDQEVFRKNCLTYISKHKDNISKDQLVQIMSHIRVYDIEDKSLINYLMEKSLEYKEILITPYNTDFKNFSQLEQTKYIEILNSKNSEDFSFLRYKIADKDGDQHLCSIYKEHYYAENEDKNKIAPSFHYNAIVLNKQPMLFFKNKLISEDDKLSTFQQLLNDDSSGLILLKTFNLIKEIDISELVKPMLEKLVSQNKYNQKNNIIEIFSMLTKKEDIVLVADKILNSQEIKNGLLNILKQKIKSTTNQYEIKNFKNVIDDHTNMNFIQYLMFNKDNGFVTHLCKIDKEFMQAFNNPVHKNINGFVYEKSPLDLAIQKVIPNSVIEELYLYKVINKTISKVNQDKVCAFLFKSFKEANEDTRYYNVLNAISLMPKSLVNKYYNYWQELLSDKKLKDIDTVRNMIKISDSLPEKIDGNKKRNKL